MAIKDKTHEARIRALEERVDNLEANPVVTMSWSAPETPFSMALRPDEVTEIPTPKLPWWKRIFK